MRDDAAFDSIVALAWVYNQCALLYNHCALLCRLPACTHLAASCAIYLRKSAIMILHVQCTCLRIQEALYRHCATKLDRYPYLNVHGPLTALYCTDCALRVHYICSEGTHARARAAE